MAISTQSLFHFTSKAEYLISILANGFFPRYFLEEAQFKNWADVAIPMVCFCDLPLSDVTDHIGFYGNYGIGLRKEWALKNGMNPIIYLSNTSTIYECLDAFINGNLMTYKKLKDGNVSREHIDLFIKELGIYSMLIMDFVKPFSGKMFRNEKNVDKYFYDEREWRYIPKLEESNKDWRLSKEEYLSSITLAQANAQLSKKHILKFNIDDIKYIIVSSEDDIYSMIKAINEIYKAENEKNRQMLCSRILTVKQIKEDF
jgi:hypothetical protein